MLVTGLALAFLDQAGERTQEFNRWYDLDHMPEHVSKPDVLMGRRYVAARGVRNAPGVQGSDVTGGHPPYATLYFFGGPTDFLGDEARAGWVDKDRDLVKAGRFWVEGSVVHFSFWTLVGADARAGMHVSAGAVPYLGHRSVVFVLGRAATADRRAEAVEWWERTQREDLLGLPGVLAVLALDPTPQTDQDLLLHLVLCESPAANAVQGIAAMRDYQRLTGRYPAHRGVYETVALLPYDVIQPLEYDFQISG